jgi:transposase
VVSAEAQALKLNQFRRLSVRYDKRAEIHEAFLSLGCALICWQSLRKS